ncbi:MAG: putative acyl-CoA dehydrogenase [bacterium]|nr:putative acyl-CoA dehydrogenase [bacterium]
MSTEEKSASFLKSLFAGEIEQEMIFPYPKMKPEAQENLQSIVDAFNEFARDHIKSEEMDRLGYIPKNVWDGLKQLGFFGLSIPEQYGGAGLPQTAYSRVFEQICNYDASLAVSLGAHLSIGSKGIILYGNDQQKEKYLPRMASGEKMGAFALTEAGAGSDAAGIQSKAVLDASKKFFILNGGKIWITNGGLAEVLTVFAKTDMVENGEKKEKITGFIVERGMAGFTSGKPEEKLGIHGSNTTSLNFDNVQLPVENMLGPMGKGFKVAMEILNVGRLGLASGCLGGCKVVTKMAIEHAKNRKQFGKAIAQFEMIQEKIARMVADTYAAESMVYLTTALADREEVDFSLESAISKIFVSEAIWNLSNEAMQIAGGIGYSRDYPYERILRDSRINLIFEGTNEILRAFVALSGIQGPGEYLKKIGKALRDPIKGFGLLTGYAVQKVKDKVAHDQLTGVHPKLSDEVAKFNEYAKALHQVTERVLMKHGKDIILKQFIQRRLADMVIDLYAMIAVMARVDTLLKADANEAQQDLLVAKTFIDEAWRRIRRNHRQIDENIDHQRKQVCELVYERGGYPFKVNV